jgi:endonuclease YncB( thermonuclease family)
VATIRERDGFLISDSYETNPFADEERVKGIKVGEWLLEKGLATVYSPKENRR